MYIDYLFADHEIIKDKAFKESGIRNRPDFRIPELKLIIEFDGYRHFSDTKTIKADFLKDSTYESLGYKIIRIPYFIQMRAEVITGLFCEYLNIDFKNSMEIESKYPSGFISDKAMLPADYCELGIYVYNKHYHFYNKIFDKFYRHHDFTLMNKINELDSILRVYPISILKDKMLYNEIISHITITENIKNEMHFLNENYNISNRKLS